MYILDGTDIRSPLSLTEENSTQLAQHRTLDGTIRRDYFGDNKRKWTLRYVNTKKADYDEIKTIYDAYLLSSSPVSWEVTETNYTISATTVHVDLLQREFGVKGVDYISEFVLILTED